MRKIGKIAGMVAAAIAASAAMSASAQAVTIGTTLNVPPATAEGCEIVVFPQLRDLGVPPSCTFFAPNTQTPPGNYVITTGRIRTGPRTGPMVFTAVEAMRSKSRSSDGMPGRIICCVATAESQVFTPAPNSVVEVPMRLPMKNTTELIDGEQIEVITYLGITLLDLGSSVPLANSSAPVTSFFAPALRAGGQALMNGFSGTAIPLINGEFTPCAGARAARAGRAGASAGCTGPVGNPGGGGSAGSGGSPNSGGPGNSGSSSDFTVARRVKLVARGTAARLVTRVPRAGILRIRPTARFRRLVAKGTRRAKAGRNSLLARLSRPGRRALARRGRLRAAVVITYRPRGGKATSKRRTIVFRRATRG